MKEIPTNLVARELPEKLWLSSDRSLSFDEASIRNSVFVVRASKNVGTGFFIAEDRDSDGKNPTTLGWALTCLHVLACEDTEPSSEIITVGHQEETLYISKFPCVRLSDQGEWTKAKTVLPMPNLDMALILAERGVVAPILPSRVAVPDPIYTMGALFGHSCEGVLSVKEGVVSAFHNGVDIPNMEVNGTIMEISAPIYRGNSGGPVLDRQGNVVGVICAGEQLITDVTIREENDKKDETPFKKGEIPFVTESPTAINYAVPILDVIAELKEHMTVERGWNRISEDVF